MPQRRVVAQDANNYDSSHGSHVRHAFIPQNKVAWIVADSEWIDSVKRIISKCNMQYILMFII